MVGTLRIIAAALMRCEEAKDSWAATVLRGVDLVILSVSGNLKRLGNTQVRKYVRED